MKKTLTVNLGGSVFNIDEDAYELLDKYLTNLRIHFRKEEGSDEIMNDFESRISELLGERKRLGYEVINIGHVEDVIKRMGSPEEIFEEGNPHAEKDIPLEEEGDETGKKKKKRLMRDSEDRILGGVASGIAAYLNIDPTAVRLALILLLFIPYIPVVIPYLILWLVMPLAQTATDRLIMRGKSVNLQNIGKSVTDGFEKTSAHINDYISSDKPRTTLQKFADFLVTFVGVLLKVFAIIIGIILLPVLVLVIFVLFIVIFALFAGGAGALIGTLPFIGPEINFITAVPTYLTVLGSIGAILLLGIPVIALIYLLCGKIFKLSPMPNPAKWILLGLWIVSLILCLVYAYHVGYPPHWGHIDWLPWSII